MDKKTKTLLLNTDNIGICVPLYCSVFNAEPWNDGWSEEAVYERLSTFTKIPHFEGLVHEIEGEPVAMVLGWGERWTKGWTFLIKEMCVHPSQRRSGLGANIMLELEQQLIDKGYLDAYLETLSEGPSVDFYSSLNFRTIALVMMKKKLG